MKLASVECRRITVMSKMGASNMLKKFLVDAEFSSIVCSWARLDDPQEGILDDVKKYRKPQQILEQDGHVSSVIDRCAYGRDWIR